MKAVERDPAGGWIARDPKTGKELEEGWRWNTRASARDAVWQFLNLPPTRGVKARPELESPEVYREAAATLRARPDRGNGESVAIMLELVADSIDGVECQSNG